LIEDFSAAIPSAGPTDHSGTKAAIELYPIAGKKASPAAAEAGLSASSIPTLLVEGDDKPGLGFAIAQAIAGAKVNMTFFVAQSMKQRLVRAGVLR